MSAIWCKAAVCWEMGHPMKIEKVKVNPPEKGQVRIKLTSASICESDMFAWQGKIPGNVSHMGTFPTILGHEGAGVVESVGEGVDNIKKGDHVVPTMVAHCGRCDLCIGSQGPGCRQLNVVDEKPVIETADGTKLNLLFRLGTFSEYICLDSSFVSVVADDIPLGGLSPVGCGVLTGWGSAECVAGVTKDSTCAVIGMGCVGLSAMMACVKAGAKTIIAVDTVPSRLELSRKLGATHVILGGGSVDVVATIKDITNGGVDFCFECTGVSSVARQTLDSIHDGWGVAVLVGLQKPSATLDFESFQLILRALTVKGSLLGGYKHPLKAISRLAMGYHQEKMPDIDALVTKRFPLEKINEAFETQNDKSLNVLKIVITF